MDKKQLKGDILAGVLILLGFIVVFGFMYGWFFPAKPSVLLHLAPNYTNITGFAYAKYPGSMMCIACTNFHGIVKVYHNDALICEADESQINLGEVLLAIRCNKELANYEGKEVLVEATGRVTHAGSRAIESYDQKNITLTFYNKK